VGAGQAGRDPRGGGTGRSDDLQPFRFGPLLLLGRQHGHDADAVDLELGVDPNHIARLGAGGQQRAVENTAGFERPGGAPGPAAIGLRAGQLDVDTACHDA
jgi:hypothetical protein